MRPLSISWDVNVLVLFLLALVTVFNYQRGRDYRYPAFLASALWLAALTLYCISPIAIDSVSPLTPLIFLAVVLSFTAGAEIIHLIFPMEFDVWAWHDLSRPCLLHRSGLRTLLLLLSAGLLPFVFLKANAIAQQSGFSNWFVGLRVETSDVGPSAYGILGNASIISFVTTFVWSIEIGSGWKQRAQYFSAIAISIAYAILGTGRTSFLLLIVALIAISSMRGRLNWRMVSAACLCFVVIFAAFAVILGKGGSLDSGMSDNVKSVKESLTQYAIGSIPAFDQIVRSDAPFEYGANTFLAGVNLVHRFSDGRLTSPIQKEVYVPFPWNVYTAAQPPFLDFGIIGVIVAFSTIGAVSTYCYCRAARGYPQYIFYYALILFPLAVMTFTDQYFAPVGSWLKYVVLGYLYFKFSYAQRAATVRPISRTAPYAC